MEETTLMQERKKRILAYMESEEYRPMKRKEMRTMLSVPAEDKEKFDALMKATRISLSPQAKQTARCRRTVCFLRSCTKQSREKRRTA